MIEERRKILSRAAREFDTPLYVYFMDDILARFAELGRLFGDRFGVSYAVKANPNTEILRRMAGHVTTFDVSSFAEAERVVAAGVAPRFVTFSGPAKRHEELRRAIDWGVGELVCESVAEAQRVDALARERGHLVDIMLRINPQKVPRRFGASMAGKPSQFGIDEEDMADALDAVIRQTGTRLIGLHIYSGTNCLHADALQENFEIFLDIFRRACGHADLSPHKLVFGSGFGIPYLPDEDELDIEDTAARLNPLIDALHAESRFARTECVLEMGRWLIGREGYLLTSVVQQKRSRGTEIRICDAGFNNHLAACGMMGSVIRRNWRIAKVSGEAPSDGPLETCNLVGPLCTTIDLIATKIELPALAPGDVLAIENSGAYGLTASPTRFISHPEPREVIASGSGTLTEVTESTLNHWGPERPARRDAVVKLPGTGVAR